MIHFIIHYPQTDADLAAELVVPTTQPESMEVVRAAGLSASLVRDLCLVFSMWRSAEMAQVDVLVDGHTVSMLTNFPELDPMEPVGFVGLVGTLLVAWDPDRPPVALGPVPCDHNATTWNQEVGHA